MSTAALVIVLLVALVVVATAGTLVRRSQQSQYSLHAFKSNEVEDYRHRLRSVEMLSMSQPRAAAGAGKRLVDDMLTTIGLPERDSDRERLRDLRIVDPRSYKAYRDAARTPQNAPNKDQEKAMRGYLGISRRLLEKASPRISPEGEAPTS